ncbi:MAG: hypothetical protein GWP58_07030, partial [Gammaproteobacteria bacterium]|nr:hypothetical protein [Gammaproteobacteria bacterium]
MPCFNILMHIMARMVLAVTLVLLVFTLHAQDEEAEDSEPDQGLDLFDGDVEETGLGWAQFTASAGLMYLDADGSFTARLPDGRVVTIIDFDR